MTEPAPFSLIVTFVAFSNLLSATVIGVIPQVVPLVLLSVINGHCPFKPIVIDKKRAAKKKTLVILLINVHKHITI